MEKLISVIIPCYNVEKYIDRCFSSLVNQTIGIECLELIFVDDCSTDNTWQRLLELEAGCPDSVIVIHCEENGRQGKARNIGMQYASAPYIGFVDSDDWVEQEMYERLYEKMKEHDCDMVMCRNWRDSAMPDQILSPKQTEEESCLLKIDTEDKRKTFLACASIGFGVWDKLFCRDFLQDNQIYFPEKLAYEDHYFSTLLYFYARKVYILEERLYHYFVNTQSTVLATNATYHFDILKVDCMLWEECENRGFLDKFRKEMEYQFLTLCYLASMKMIVLRFAEPPYDYFLRLKEETLERVPDYTANPYVKELVTEINKIILELLTVPIKEAEFKVLCNDLRGYIQKGLLRI